MKRITPPKKRRYNATYRLRKKGYRVSLIDKTIYSKEFDSLPREAFLLREEYGYEIQKTIT